MLETPQVPLASVYLPAEKRIRIEKGDIEGLAHSIKEKGQLQPILVNRFDPAKHPEAKGSFDWTLVDGERRYLAFEQIYSGKGPEVKGIEPGKIKVTLTDHSDELSVLLLEFHANADRKDFTWDERARFARMVHDICNVRYPGWKIPQTAAFLNISSRLMYDYLDITSNEKMFEELAKEATSFQGAKKKQQIKREHIRRKVATQARKAAQKKAGTDVHQIASGIIKNADLHEWFPTIDDESLDWFHVDPPYGGLQQGGMSTHHEKIDDDPEYAFPVMRYIVEQAYRVMKDRAWMAFWFHPSYYEHIRKLLEEEGFWVNPYPCIWFKPNRKADGHEIRRFLVNAYETFFLCSKGDKAVLSDSGRQNVFIHEMPTSTKRLHVMHKPKDLIGEILKVISVIGEAGGDCCFGSGSSIVAAFENDRTAIGCELSEQYYLVALEELTKTLEGKLIAANPSVAESAKEEG